MSILDIFGLFTNKEYREMYSYLNKRFTEEWKRAEELEKMVTKYRRIALDLASKYRDEEAIKKLL
jgi:hypothetical protein